MTVRSKHEFQLCVLLSFVDIHRILKWVYKTNKNTRHRTYQF